MPTTNRRIVLASRPTGAPREDNFRLETVPIPDLAPGQVLDGPALVESATTTVLLRQDERATTTDHGWLDIALPGAAAT